MKLVINGSEFYGDTITRNSDHWAVDNTILPFTVVGSVGTIEDGDKPIVQMVEIPQSLKMAQCRAQLILDGKDDDVELLINSIEDPIKQKLYRAFWEYEPIVLRDNAMINEMAPALAIDLDEFFVNASKL